MNNNSPIKTTPIQRSDPNLRKLARALIAIARQELAREAEAETRLLRSAAAQLKAARTEASEADSGEAA